MTKRFYLLYIALLLSLASNAQTFAHYLGYANTEYSKRGMQKVHEIEYYYYVSPDGSPINLLLPIENFTGGGGNLEPMAYFRWYDYTTDMASPRLSTYSGKTQLKPMTDADNRDRGLIAYNLADNPCLNNVGVVYNPPADAKSADWQGETLACDVSKYADFGGNGATPMTAEPTLSYRCIFHILPGARQANDIVNASSADKRGRSGDLTIEDNRRIVFGAKERTSSLTLRTNNPQTRYFFHPIRSANRHIYANDESHLLKSGDYNMSVTYQSAYIQWRVYDPTKTKYTILGYASGQMWSYTAINTLINNRNGWYTLDGNRTTPPDINYGDIVYFVALAEYDRYGKNVAPVANFEVLYQNTYPKSTADIMASGDNERTISYLESHYQQAMKPISFDDDNSEMDVSRPTTPENNASRLPSKWNKRTYGFVYYDLSKYMKAKDGFKFTPIHGEYGLYKSASLGGISSRGNGYRWWGYRGPIYDRTYEMSGGKQYGHFLYIDASDESRQIARADFKANLCSGTRLIFSGYVADYTTAQAKTRPQVMFRLYGVIKDADDKVTDQRLITSFSSGDFSTNVSSLVSGQWMQVYGKIVLPKNSGAENYSDFRLVMDNMCQGTSGADYLIDDLRLYIQSAKVDVLQSKPVCPSDSRDDDTPSGIKLTIRAGYDNVSALVGGKASRVFYRICDAKGAPLDYIDYDGDGRADKYGTAEVPDPSSHKGDYLIIANRHFPLRQGEAYYVSVAYPSEDNDSLPGVWGVPTSVCSTYSKMFEIVRQDIVVSDANGNVVTTVRVSCDRNRTPDVNINARLETADLANGGKVSLDNVRFDWFFSEVGKANDFAEIKGLQEALRHFRDAYPDTTSLVATARGQYTDADCALLRTYVDNKRLLLSASNSISNYHFAVGTFSVAAVPIAARITTGGQTYDICPDPMYFSLRVVEDGPKLTLGFKDVVYPSDDRSVRIGLPQIRAMKARGGSLSLPVASLESTKVIEFTDSSSVFIAATNDPTFDNAGQVIAHIVNPQLTQDKDETLSVRFVDGADKVLHEGYWYELNFSYRQKLQRGEHVISCPGDMFFTVKVVPEYATWNSSQQNSLNANWNNDLNWQRSTAAELYRHDYTDYGDATYGGNAADARLSRQQAYVPMKFTKVTIADQTGKVYPDLGNITYRSGNRIATKLTNAKGESATDNIAYDMAVKWTATTDDHSDTGSGSFSCETFQGNLCDAIYFKPHTELLDPCYLVYNRAYVEKELKANRWYIASSPLRDTYAGDMYVPAASGRQETEAFCPVTFAGDRYSRVRRPFYQRQWDGNGEETVEGLTFYGAFDFDDQARRIDTLTDQSLNIESMYWSHVYNKVDESYADGRAFSIKAGDDYTAKDGEAWLLRLPKADTTYCYYNSDATESAVARSVDKRECYRLLVEPSTAETSYSPLTEPLADGIHAADRYRLVGNPYTATLSVRQFLKGNPNFAGKVWTLEAGRLSAYVLNDADDGSGSGRQGDVLIEPMQAFFVKLRDGATATEAYFTTAMTVDRWVSGGTTAQVDDGKLSITATKAGRSSTACVVVADGAKDEYDDSEDAELLRIGDLDSVPQIYTVASGEAVEVNRLAEIGWLSVGVVAKDEGSVDMEFSLNARMRGRYWLFDSKRRSFTPITDGCHISLSANEHGRYYLTGVSGMDSRGEESIDCYSPGCGMITVCSPDARLADVDVYGIGGTSVVSRRGIGLGSLSVTTGSGVFVVKATTEKGKSLTRKIIVR